MDVCRELQACTRSNIRSMTCGLPTAKVDRAPLSRKHRPKRRSSHRDSSNSSGVHSRRRRNVCRHHQDFSRHRASWLRPMLLLVRCYSNSGQTQGRSSCPLVPIGGIGPTYSNTSSALKRAASGNQGRCPLWRRAGKILLICCRLFTSILVYLFRGLICKKDTLAVRLPFCSRMHNCHGFSGHYWEGDEQRFA